MYLMRTTIDLPDDLHRLAKTTAHDRGITFSEAVAYLIRRAVDTSGKITSATDPVSGLPTIRVGRPITTEDVRSLDDEQ